MENYGIIELTDEKFVMWCGGDWQDATNMEIRLIDGELTVVSVFESDCEEQVSEEELTEEQFIKLLNDGTQ